MSERPANLMLDKMYQLAMSTEEEGVNVLNVLMRMQAMDLAMRNAFLLAKHDAKNRIIDRNIILDNPTK